MDIRNRKELHASAAALSGHPGGQRTALIYVGFACGLSLAVFLLDLLLSRQINNTGGLSSMGLRSVLITIQTVLPVARMLFMLSLTQGYKAAMLELLRRRSTAPGTMKEGFRRFGPLIRFSLLEGLLYAGLGFAAIYIGSSLFLLLPSSEAFMTLVSSGMNITDGTLVLDEAVLLSAIDAVLPLYWICGILCLVLIIPTMYSYRMAAYCLCEDPVPGALAVMRQSRNMMRRNRFALFLVDLSLWWYYLLEALVIAVAMGADLLALAGIVVPGIVGNLVFPVLSLALQLCLYYTCLNRVTLTYAAAYEALRPKPESAPKGVALGNIFDLYRESNEYRESQDH